MNLEPANIVCPKCGSPNYMRHLIGKGVGKLDMKCINCNSYFNFDELYKQKIAEVLKPKTNADRIRSMSDYDMADWIADILNHCDNKAPEDECLESCPLYACCNLPFDNIENWLKSPVKGAE